MRTWKFSESNGAKPLGVRPVLLREIVAKFLNRHQCFATRLRRERMLSYPIHVFPLRTGGSHRRMVIPTEAARKLEAPSAASK